MGAVVREINGVKGFCEYKNGVPYTYIKTRHAILMLGLIDVRDGKKYMRIRRFGQYFETVLQDESVSNQPVQIGISISPNYAISQDTTFATGGESNAPWRPSKYDSILPEFILDRVIFAIANIMNSDIAKKFRFELFNTIIPHFQQTATQDQINQVPILKYTTQFMYDNNNYQVVAQQSYNFAKQILDMHLNRLAVLRKDDFNHIFAKTTKEYSDILELNEENNLIFYLDEFLDNTFRISGVRYERSLDTLKGSIIFNQRIYSEYISYLIHLIRDEEDYLIREVNGETLVRKEVHEPSGNIEEYDEIEYKEPSRISPVRFLNMRERFGY